MNRRAIVGIVALSLAGSLAARAEEPEPNPLIEPAAVDPVKRMVQTLTGAKALSYKYHSAYDAVQDDGEILEFGARSKVTIRRPDRVRGEIWERGGRHVNYAWDGQAVTVYDDTKQVVATTPRTGDLDSLIDFLRDEIGFELPLADLFRADLRQLLVDGVVAARHVGKETLHGFEVDHVALRMRTGVDVQLWIRSGDPAVPERVVLNFSTADGRPQFRADVHEWEIDRKVRDSHFALKVPKDTKRVPFMKPKRTAQAATQDAP